MAKGNKVIKETKKGRFIVMQDTGKTGFGKYKIIGNKATRAEAERL